MAQFLTREHPFNVSAGLFPRSSFYRHFLQGAAPLVREPGRASRLFPWSERHLQCVWYDPALRPSQLFTEEREPVTVEEAGIWNMEAGPDFLGAVLQIGPGRRRLTGDVEIHVQGADWQAHGHAGDKRYSRVKCHVTYFPSPRRPPGLPASAVQIALKDALAANPLFSFDNLDIAAYPYAARAAPAPCTRALAGWTPDQRESLLQAAGEERLRRKAERMRTLIEEKNSDQALYEEILCALGYKHNKAPFRRLAELVPLATLRQESRGRPLVAYALLAGVAGLLPEQFRSNWDNETREFIRVLWDAWWKRREKWEGRIIPRTSWRLSGMRPMNRPERRLMAAACLFANESALSQQWQDLASRHPDAGLKQAGRMLEVEAETYWSRRLAWSGVKQAKPIELIGEARIHAILNNIFVPFLGAQNIGAPFEKGLLSRLPTEAENALVRQTAVSLFGPDHPPSLYRDGLRQQGLLQIFHDFCLNDRSRCAFCPLPDLLQQHTEKINF